MKRLDLLSINEAAQRIGVSRQALHAAINAGKVQVTKVPSVKLMVSPEALAAFEPNRKMQEVGKRPKRTPKAA